MRTELTKKEGYLLVKDLEYISRVLELPFAVELKTRGFDGLAYWEVICLMYSESSLDLEAFPVYTSSCNFIGPYLFDHTTLAYYIKIMVLECSS